jgi:hypothetical protein
MEKLTSFFAISLLFSGVIFASDGGLPEDLSGGLQLAAVVSGSRDSLALSDMGEAEVARLELRDMNVSTRLEECDKVGPNALWTMQNVAALKSAFLHLEERVTGLEEDAQERREAGAAPKKKRGLGKLFGRKSSKQKSVVPAEPAAEAVEAVHNVSPALSRGDSLSHENFSAFSRVVSAHDEKPVMNAAVGVTFAQGSEEGALGIFEHSDV